MKDGEHIIWSNYDLDVDDDWRDAYREHLEINDEKVPEELNESDVYAYMVETNSSYLDDERMNLNIQMDCPILIIGDLGLWNGRRMGYKEIPSGNIRDCLCSDTDYSTWYVDKLGDLRCDAVHHDGTNHYLYRAYKDEANEKQIDELKEKIWCGSATREDIARVTRRLGGEIGKVYGWDFQPENDDGSDNEGRSEK